MDFKGSRGIKITMGFLDILLGRKPKEAPAQAVMRYELYGHAPGGKWFKLMDLEKPIEFEEFQDAMPGYTYKLLKRLKSGQTVQMWYRHLPGPGAVQVKTIGSIEEMQKALVPLKEFGEQIEGLKEAMAGMARGPLAWAFPERQKTGGWSWQPTAPMVKDKTAGDAEREWLRLVEEAVAGANRMSLAEYERMREVNKVEDIDTAVVEEEPKWPLRVCNECGLEAWTQEDLEFFVKSPRSKYDRMNLCKECHRSYFRKGGKYA